MSRPHKLALIRQCLWTLELLGETLIQNDEACETDQSSSMSFRNTAGVHQAIMLVSRLASDHLEKLDDLEDGG